MADHRQRMRIVALAAILILVQDSEYRKWRLENDETAVVRKKKPRRWWVRPWILDKTLPECNTVFKLQLELEKVGKKPLIIKKYG